MFYYVYTTSVLFMTLLVQYGFVSISQAVYT